MIENTFNMINERQESKFGVDWWPEKKDAFFKIHPLSLDVQFWAIIECLIE